MFRQTLAIFSFQHTEFDFILFNNCIDCTCGFFNFILKSLILTCVPKHEPPSHLPPLHVDFYFYFGCARDIGCALPLPPGSSNSKELPAMQEDLGLIPRSRRSQYSCLESSTDRGAWRVIQSMELQSQTLLGDFH